MKTSKFVRFFNAEIALTSFSRDFFLNEIFLSTNSPVKIYDYIIDIMGIFFLFLCSSSNNNKSGEEYIILSLRSIMFLID